MKGIGIRWLILTVAIIITSYLIDGIVVSNLFSAFLAAMMLGILNAFLRPLLIILTLPINILSFGIFTLVINAFMLELASVLIPGFEVHGFWAAVFGTIFISLISWLINVFINGRGHVEYIELKYKGGNRWE